MRCVLAILCILILTSGAEAAVARRPVSRKQPARRRVLGRYRRKIANRHAAARAVGSGAINTARNYPHEWGRGPGGFAKRIGSGFGESAVKGTIEMGVGTALHEDLHYRRSHLKGKWPRLKYAVKRTFVVPRTRGGGKTVAAGRIAGNMGAGVASRAWMPASAAGMGAGVASGGVGIGADVGANVAREFWPQKKKHRHQRR